MIPRWVPSRGDMIWLDFDPQAGHEQAGYRPALVLSENQFNARGMAIVCPITSKVKGYPFEVIITKDGKITGSVLADQIKSIDWKVRGARLKEKLEASVLEKVLHHLKLICSIR